MLGYGQVYLFIFLCWMLIRKSKSVIAKGKVMLGQSRIGQTRIHVGQVMVRLILSYFQVRKDKVMVPSFFLFRMLIGKSESVIAKGSNPKETTKTKNPNSKLSLQFVLQILTSYWKRTFVGLSNLFTNCPSSICPHGKTDTCLIYILKVWTYFKLSQVW